MEQTILSALRYTDDIRSNHDKFENIFSTFKFNLIDVSGFPTYNFSLTFLFINNEERGVIFLWGDEVFTQKIGY